MDFIRNWEEYRHGFGDLQGEFWWGNEKLRNLTEHFSSTWELVVDLEAFDGDVARVHYGDFSISGNTFDLDVDVFEDLIGTAGNLCSPLKFVIDIFSPVPVAGLLLVILICNLFPLVHHMRFQVA